MPTMGALHAGHEALIAAARQDCDTVVVSLFVNPAQFGDPADLAAYPRDEERDLRVAEVAGADVLFAPAVEELYPPGFQTWVDVEEVARGLEGEHRPGHFRGVATICLKLFNIVRPRYAYFGQKDAQQLAVLRRMVRDLDLDVSVISVPTVRDEDGLALSSRNVLLSPAERERALALPRALATRDLRRGARRALRARRRLRRARRLRPARPRRRDSRRLHPPDRQRRPRQGGSMTTRPRKPAPGTPAPGKVALTELAELKARRQPIAMITAYDAPSGRLADAAGADIILVGDSAAMTVLGHDSTVPATMDEMIVLTRAVNRGARRPLVVADMPFGSFQVSDEDALENAIRFLKEASADAVKVEGAGADAFPCPRARGRRRADDGPHRPDPAVGDDARRLQGAGPHSREGAPPRRGRARARGRRRVRARPRGGSGSGRGADHRAADDPDDRDRRRRRLRRPGARLARPARPLRGPLASVRQAVRRPRERDHEGRLRLCRRRPRAALPGGAAHLLDAGGRAGAFRGVR